MLRFAADEDFENRIVRGLLRLLASQIRRASKVRLDWLLLHSPPR